MGCIHRGEPYEGQLPCPVPTCPESPWGEELHVATPDAWDPFHVTRLVRMEYRYSDGSKSYGWEAPR